MVARGRANLDALRVVRDPDSLLATAKRGEVAQWSGWGALAPIFGSKDLTGGLAEIRDDLKGLLSDREWRQAAASTINAHYTPPEIASAIWEIVTAAGYRGGTVLEPGAGSGVFAATAPAAAWEAGITAVEKDPVTAAIAAYLHPDLEVVASPLEDWQGSGYSAAVGNVPFADVRILEPDVSAKRQLTLHNFAIAKALHACAPGGVVAVVTSAFTLDADQPSQRLEIGRYGGFLGAVRLPDHTFAAHSGTRVTTDVVMFQRRPEILTADQVREQGGAWLHCDRYAHGTVEDTTLLLPAAPMNSYLVQHPDRVLGEVQLGNGMYRADQARIVSDDSIPDIAAKLAAAGRAIIAAADLAPVPTSSRPRTRRPDAEVTVGRGGEWSPPEWAKQGSVFATPAGFVQIDNGSPVPWDDAPKGPKLRDEVRSLCRLRDSMIDLIAAEAADRPDSDLEDLRAKLIQSYDTYVARYGPISRFTWTEPRADGVSASRRYPQMGGFRKADPDLPALLALENFDEDTQTATKADIFHRRVVGAPSEPKPPESIEEAVAQSLREKGTVDIAYVTKLWPDTTPEKLIGVCYLDPVANRWEPASRYLSGNVRKKLAAARDAAASDPQYRANVEALEKMRPVDLEPSEIGLKLGVPWLEPDEVRQFLVDTLGVDARSVSVTRSPAGWNVSGTEKWSLAVTSEFGTESKNAFDLAEIALNNRQVAVRRNDPDGASRLDPEATLAAQEKIETLNDALVEWAWDHDPERASILQRRYNERFRAYVPARYDGSWVKPEGLRDGFELRKHQRDAVAHLLMEGDLLAGHVVGAGKTATMATGAMEMRRLGLAAKPAIVVPNHLVTQVAAEFRQLYPTASVLIPHATETSKAGRKELAARIATGDWDGVVLPESLFTRIGMPAHVEANFLERQTDEYRRALASINTERVLSGAEQRSVKQMEKMLATREQKVKDLRSKATDDGVTWDQLGVDFLFVDEAHRFKNREIISGNRDLSVTGAKRATDLDIKLQWMREQYPGRGVVCLSTGTPVANKVSELHTMQSYLQPARLREAGIESFDDWAAQFGRVVTRQELAPAGKGWRLKSRFAEYQNVPELMALLGQNADIRLAEDLDLPRPQLKGGRAEVDVIAATDALKHYVDELVERSEKLSAGWQASKGDDNMLNITTDGRKAALDLRLVGRHQPSGSKLDRLTDRVAHIWQQNRDRTYIDPTTGEASSKPGAFQMVFCDLGTPGNETFDAYQAVKDGLVARGIPERDVAFIHDANKPAEKAQMFARCRSGDIAVLVGSTEKMGTGTNVQARMIALHHLDPTWRPADIEQREGRILRQGNQNPEVEVIRYATEESFDVYMWQTLESKARFIGQALAARFGDTREMGEVDPAELSYAEVKALATGDPRVVERAELGTELTRLQRLQASHQRDQQRLRHKIELRDQRGPLKRAQVSNLDQLIERRTDGNTRYLLQHPEPTSGQINDWIRQQLRTTREGEPTRLGAVNGISVFGERAGRWDFAIRIGDHEQGPRVRLTREEVMAPNTAVTIRVENEIQRLDRTLDATRHTIAHFEEDAAAAERRLGKRFKHQARLDEVKRRINELEAEFAADADKTAAVAPGSTQATALDRSGVSAASSETPTSSADVAARRAAGQLDRLRRRPGDRRVASSEIGLD